MREKNILTQETVKLKNFIKEAQVNLNLQNNDLQIEINAKNDSILALQNSLKEMDIKHQKALVQQKQKLSEKDKEISVLQKNLNTKSVEDFAPEEEGFQCKLCNKLNVSKDFLSSHIQNSHASSKYPKKGYFRCRTCGKELNNRKLVENHIVVQQ